MLGPRESERGIRVRIPRSDFYFVFAYRSRLECGYRLTVSVPVPVPPRLVLLSGTAALTGYVPGVVIDGTTKLKEATPFTFVVAVLGAPKPGTDEVKVTAWLATLFLPSLTVAEIVTLLPRWT